MTIRRRSPRALFAMSTGIACTLMLGTLAVSTPARAADPACGPLVSGVHQVSTAAQLQSIGSGGDCLLSSSYRQVADIVLPSPVAPAVSNWAPIGSSAQPFTGTFDGGNHTITGLRIITPSLNDIGLFGVTAGGAALRNIHVLNVNISGNARVGAIVGDLTNGSNISQSSSTGTVRGHSKVGGLVGQSGGSTAVTITDTMSSAAVTADVQEAGGLVGGMADRALITRSYATGNILSANYAGGLTGGCCSAQAEFTTDSFARGNIGATTFGAGGLVGGAFNSQTYTRVYASGIVTAANAKGGLLGGVSNTGTWSASFWDTATTTAAGGFGNGVTVAGTTGLATAGMTTLSTFSNAGWDISAGVNDDSEWGIDPSINDGYPFLTWSARSLTYDAGGGTGAPSGAQALVWESVAAAGTGGMERPGFTFDSWNTRADGSGASYAPGELVVLPWHSRDGVSTVTTLYAQWTAPAPAPTPPIPSDPPSGVTAAAGDTSAAVSWVAPASSGSLPISSYLVTSSPGGRICLTTTLSCTVAGLTNGTAYTFTVQALTGAGWSPSSTPSNVVVPRAPERPTITITGSRDGKRIAITGTSTGLGMGAIAIPWTSRDGAAYVQRRDVLIAEDGTFTWSRRAKAASTWRVYVTSGDLRSNTVRIR